MNQLFASVPSRPTITVTQEQIDTAIRNDSGHCMVADSIKRDFPDLTRILVDVRTIRFTNPLTHKRYTYLTPATIATKILQWDQGIKPTPFSFQLQSPIQVAHGRKRASSTKVIKVRSHSRHAPIVIGGRSLPLAPLAASTPDRNRHRPFRTRQFGIRALDLTKSVS